MSETTTTINVREINLANWRELGARAVRLGTTRQKLLDEIIADWLTRQSLAERGQSAHEIAYAAGVRAGKGLK